MLRRYTGKFLDADGTQINADGLTTGASCKKKNNPQKKLSVGSVLSVRNSKGTSEAMSRIETANC